MSTAIHEHWQDTEVPKTHRSNPRASAKLGAVLSRHRTARGLSQKKLAAASRVDRTYIGRVESGERGLGLVALARLADVLGVDFALEVLAELLRDSEDVHAWLTASGGVARSGVLGGL